MPDATWDRLRPARILSLLVLALGLIGATLVALPAPVAHATCANAIACENELPGNDPSEWQITGAGDPNIQGFATQMSVNAGSTVQFKIDSQNKGFSIEIYRLGYYQGLGARRVATIAAGAVTVQSQPSCVSSTATAIYDCGTWKVSASWAVPSTAVSGVYIAHLVLSGSGGDSHIPFVVRNDGNTSTVLMKTSDATWQAYNLYGAQADFYSSQLGNNGRAYKISYNRPFATRSGTEARDFLFSNEFPMIRFLEQNGYDVSYASDIDVATDANLVGKHKVFLSVGHDEYWTKSERANVAAARDAGTNLAFFSGNEVYWKTRLEPSQDGTDTANRTLVCYKDTWASDDNTAVQLDPVEPTPTWRDPSFGDLGFGPENELTGQMFQANSDDLALTVGAEEGKLRFWRNTGLASMTGTSTKLADHTVGYESDEDVDNGYRPAGLIRMSTTVGDTPEYLQDYGRTVAPGTTTHHLTLYRATSGALVFGAGTVQWAWGLDANHDGEDVQPADPRIRQATVNILADMSAQPTTRAADLAAAVASTDTAAPTVTVTAPASGSSLAQGSLVTVKGTATDAAGKVAGVEVSTDGGASFHPATGTTSWTYTDILTGNGTDAIQVRASDDSVNTSTPTSVSVNSPCPCSMFGVITPKVIDGVDTGAVTLGVKFTSSAAGYISGIRFYKSTPNTGTHTGTLWNAAGTTKLGTGTFSNESSSGWQTLTFTNPVAITANTTYVAAYYAPNGHYAADTKFFSARSYKSGGLTAPGGSGATNGVYAEGNAFPSSSFQQTNYYVDVVYSATNNTPTMVSTVTPAAGSGSVAIGSSVTATFTRDVGSSGLTMAVQDPAGAVVPGSLSYDAASKTATFNPSQTLATSTVYTVTVNGTGLATPYQWTFTTADPDSDGTSCPCTLFNDSDQPLAGPDPDTVKVELGMGFTVTKAGQITGGRFFKNAENVGTHAVSLWSGNTRLATGTATNETSSGWQKVTFANPVSVTTGTTYVISYTAPVGRYGYTSNGLAGKITKGALSSVASGGRYTYGTSAPTNSSSANYFVDPIWAPPADTPPTVVSTTPGDGATGVPVSSAVGITFSVPVQAGTTDVTMKRTDTGATVSGTTSSESQGSTATFRPSDDLTPGVGYTVTVSGATSLQGKPMGGSKTISFTTGGASACPCTLLASTATPSVSDSEDGSGVTLGLRFSSTVSGSITGLRYYRDAANSGTHTGGLWNSTGTTKLAGLTFSDSGTGWQTATFASPVSISANTTYVAAYYAPNGHYSADVNYFGNQLVNTPLQSEGTGSAYAYGSGGITFPDKSYAATNYYVDVLFSTNNTDPPSVSSVTPANGSTAATSTKPTATFDRAIDTNSLTMTVTTGGAPVSGTVAYTASSKVATFTPATALDQSTTYTVSVQASSSAGVAMAGAKTWTFTTAGAPPTGTAHSLFAATDTPAVASWDDNGPVTVGVRFASSQAGSVTAVKFYGGAGNTGTQQVYLWDANGAQLATGSTSDTSVGWRTVTFDAAVAIQANTTYTVGYYAPKGHYAVTSGQFSGGYTSGTLSVPSGGATYRYPSGFPSATSNANYWVDVVVVS